MNIKIIPTLAYLLILSLLLSLSHWQWQRAQEKTQWLRDQAQAMNADVLDLNTLINNDWQALRYRPIRAKGHYDSSHQFLIDNQISEGKPGYYVMTPFIFSNQPDTAAHKAVLVNRGWLPLGQNRADLPSLSVTEQLITLEGRINYFPSVGVKLAGVEQPTDTWPSVVQVVNSDILAKKLNYPLATVQLELDKQMPEGYKREWQVSTLMRPEQHNAYAMQWLGLALTLTFLYFWYSFKK